MIAKPVFMALSLFLGTSGAETAQPAQALASSEQSRLGSGQAGRSTHLTADSPIQDLLQHPAFSGFAPLIMPRHERAVDDTMLIRDFGALLPYHTNVDPEVVVAGLNRMIDDETAGNTVFHDIYTAEQKRADPSLNETGLFFFRGKAGAPFAVIAAGGGFSYVGSVHEGFPYAAGINAEGLNAFVLRYRVSQGRAAAMGDLSAALAYIFRNAGQLGVSTEHYSLWGSSAGARLAASIGSHGTAAFGGEPLPKPAAVVMAYTAHSDYAATVPPTFVVVGAHDGISPPAAMQRRVEALRKQGTPVEYRLYDDVGHGFGIGSGTSAAGWISEAARFWKKHALISAATTTSESR
ncbi:alpha/beta hydrolase [Rhizobium acaciae]|uniref:alpha/beta hydrolase n=1 Tax=Rhizobium acaciae TaxID=2989736 RepID=UPI00221F7E21|nr:alpha/beta hydrolase [Rhizobium acaciae]MCW1754299.1 alpha/beta hydrolase [Rhizobium acaciae]